jgi:hypothetical protein
VHSSTKSIKLDKLCKSILDSDENIRSVEIIGKLGNTLQKIGSGKTMKPNSSDSLNECLLDIALGKEFGEFYGPIRYHFSKDKSVMFSFPFDENFVFVTTTKNIGPIWLATKIASIIHKYTIVFKNS